MFIPGRRRFHLHGVNGRGAGTIRQATWAFRPTNGIIEMEPGMVESWLMAMKIVANGLLWTSVLLASGLLLTWLVYLVHWRAGLF